MKNFEFLKNFATQDYGIEAQAMLMTAESITERNSITDEETLSLYNGIKSWLNEEKPGTGDLK